MAVITSKPDPNYMPHSSAPTTQDPQKREAMRREADRIIAEQIRIAKETPGAQSSSIRVNLDTGEVEGTTISRGVRSGVKQKQYAAEYADPKLNQEFGGMRVGDVLRKEAARDARAEKVGQGGSKQVFVNLYDTISNKPPPGQRRYIVNLEDRLSGGPYAYERSPGETVAASEKPISNDPLSGARAVLSNYARDLELGSFGIGAGLGNIFTGGTQSKQFIEKAAVKGESVNRATEREVEAEAIGAGLRGGYELVTTGKAEGAAADFEKLYKDIVANPGYFLGGAAASAASYFTPAAGAKVGKVVSNIAKVSRQGKRAKDLEFVSSQFFKEPLVGTEKQAKSFITSFGTETSSSRYALGTYEPKTDEIKLLTRDILKDSDFAVPKGKRGFIYSEQTTGLKKFDPSIPSGKQSGTVKGTDIFDPLNPEKFIVTETKPIKFEVPEMPIFRQKGKITQTTKFTDPLKEGGKVLVGTTETVSGKEVSRFAKALRKYQNLPEGETGFLSEADVKKILGVDPKKMKPFEFTPTTSNKPVSEVAKGNLAEARKALIEQNKTEAAIFETKSDELGRNLLKAALGGVGGMSGARAFAQEGPLGFGDTTEQAKFKGKKRKGDVDYGIGMVPFPVLDREVEKFVKDMNKGVVFTSERDALDVGPSFRGGIGTRDRKAQRALEKEIAKVTGGMDAKSITKELEGFGFDLSSASGLKTESVQGTKTMAAQMEQFSQALSQQFGQTAAIRNDIPSPTRTINLGGFIPEFEEPRRKRKKGKGRKSKYGERKLRPRDLLEVGLGEDYAKAFNKAFGLKGDPYGVF